MWLPMHLGFEIWGNWEECNQLSDTHVILKGLNPGVISKVGWVLIVRVNEVTVNNNSPIFRTTLIRTIKLNLHVIVYTTLILICLLQDAFLDMASFKPWHE